MASFSFYESHSGIAFILLLLSGITVTSYLRIAWVEPIHLLPPNKLDGPNSPQIEGSSLGAVASERSACSNIGIKMYTRGGNAADAIISAALCVGVISMYHAGIGGGGWALVRSPNGSYENINFRERAPAAAREDMYNQNDTLSVIGGNSPGVPGELRALEYLHKQYARLPWKELVQPAARIAREGFPVDEDFLHYMNKPGMEFLKDDVSWAKDFAPNGTLVGLGDDIRRPRYADTLDKISDQGANAFYEGPIAEATIAALSSTHGIMTLEDLRNYSVVLETPLQIRYRDFVITTPGAPSGGSVVLSTLRTVSGYPDFDVPENINLTTHLLDEALRFGYGKRVHLGDPLYLSGIAAYEQSMLSETTAKATRDEISPDQTLNVSEYNPAGLDIVDNAGTSALVAIDVDGMAISLTTSINDFFGSHVMVPETGVILNDHMNDFSIPNRSNIWGYVPAPANFIRPGKRPLSSITDAIVEFSANSSLYFAVSGSGGSHIITSVLQALWHVLDHGLSAPESLAQPRFHDQLLPDRISFDWNYDNSTVAFMTSLGHNCTWHRPGSSILQAIRRLPNGTLEAATDPIMHDGGAYVV